MYRCKIVSLGKILCFKKTVIIIKKNVFVEKSMLVTSFIKEKSLLVENLLDEEKFYSCGKLS